MNFKDIFTLILVSYLIIINLIAMIVTIVDKKKAQKDKWRVKEKTLFVMSAMGGSLAMYMTMLKIRHKTKKLKFMIGIPLIFIIQVVLLVLLYLYVI